MKTPLRSLLLSTALGWLLSLATVVWAQNSQKTETPAPPPPAAPAVAQEVPVAPAEAPVAPTEATPAPSAPTAPSTSSIETPPPAAATTETATTPATPSAAVEAQSSPSTEPPLRRLDMPEQTEGTKAKKSTPPKRRRSDTRTKSGGEIRSKSSGSGEAPFGDHSVPKGSRQREAVSVMGATSVEGEVEHDAVSIMGRTFVGPEAKVGGAAVAVLGPLASKGRIGREAVCVLGSADIDGPVGGEVVVVMGDLRLGPNAVVERDVVLVGGKLNKDPQAIVRDKVVNVPLFGSLGDATWLTTYFKRCIFLARPLAFGEHLGWAWTIACSFLAFYVLLALIFRRGMERCITTLETRPGLSILAALLTVLLSPVVILLLIITVVGLAVIPFLGMGLMLASLFGKAVMLAWLGRRITRFFGEGPWAHPAFAVLVGGGLVLLLYTIPVFGFLLFKLLSWVGLGVVVAAIALAMNREKPAPTGAGPTPAETPLAPAGAPAAAVPLAPLSAAPAVSPGFTGAAAVPPLAADTSPAVLGLAAGAVEPPAAAPVPPPIAPLASGLRPAPAVAPATLPRAGFWLRLGALALDGLLFILLVKFASDLLPKFLQINLGPGGVLLPLAAYAAVMWKHKATTIGGIVCGLKVVRLDGREMDWATALVRALGCFLSLFAAGLGFIWVAFDAEKQSWHDKIAGTVIVRMPKGVSLL